MSDIALVGVTKAFGTVLALDDVSIEVAEGELIALLGPSGCGKTTLLRIVAGLEQPTGGRVLIAGEDVTDRPTRERPIGLVFQSYALFPNLTVRQNVSFPLEVRGWTAAATRARVDELLDLVRLGVQADRYPNQISGGQAQRCALARALAPDPAVLLLDEPLSALDVLVRTRLRDEIRRVQQEVGTTTIYVTHDQSEALAIADRVAVMNHGRVEQVGPPRRIYGQPQTEFAASFVGNRNAIEVEVHGGRVSLGALFDVPAPAEANGRVMSYFAPESVQVRPAPRAGSGGATKAQPATVTTIGFHGALTRLQLATEIDGRPVVLNADLASRQALDFEIGTEVELLVDTADVSCFPLPKPET
ncbi:MAG TPA: ABC transporter ATP-binding protein [Candidatus Limnocylindrales bacterium]|nr:ABC transporter ATP-binding protein [Candidatus Limnocylindrales bacterium]